MVRIIDNLILRQILEGDMPGTILAIRTLRCVIFVDLRPLFRLRLSFNVHHTIHDRRGIFGVPGKQLDLNRPGQILHLFGHIPGLFHLNFHRLGRIGNDIGIFRALL